MKKLSTLFLALGIASASLSSCSRSDYAFKSNTPASQGSERMTTTIAPKPAADGLATEAVVVAPKPIEAAPVAAAPKAVEAAPVATAKALPAQSQEASAVAANATEVAKAPKLNVVQRLALKSVAKKLNKLQDSKQATAGTAKAQSLKRTSIFLAIAGLVAILVGSLIAGGSVAGGSGAGFVIGAILAYLGYIALVVGIILLIVALVRGN